MPPQHGAWAFLALPIAVAATVTELTWPLLLLAIAWVCAYPVSYFALAAVGEHGRRNADRRRYIRPALPWAIGLLAAGLPLVALQPWLVLVALGYLAVSAVSMAFAWRHDQRSLAHDFVLIAECAAMVPVAWAVGMGGPLDSPPPPLMWWLTLVVALGLLSSTLHVRSLIRARGDLRMRRLAVVVPALSMLVAVLAAVALGTAGALALVAPFAYFTCRALLIQRGAGFQQPGVGHGQTGAQESDHERRQPAPKALRPAAIGMIDLGGFVVLVVAAAVA